MFKQLIERLVNKFCEILSKKRSNLLIISINQVDRKFRLFNLPGAALFFTEET